MTFACSWRSLLLRGAGELLFSLGLHRDSLVRPCCQLGFLSKMRVWEINWCLVCLVVEVLPPSAVCFSGHCCLHWMQPIKTCISHVFLLLLFPPPTSLFLLFPLLHGVLFSIYCSGQLLQEKGASLHFFRATWEGRGDSPTHSWWGSSGAWQDVLSARCLREGSHKRLQKSFFNCLLLLQQHGVAQQISKIWSAGW